MNKTITAFMTMATLALTAETASAHVPVGGGFGAGLAHPFHGLDHLLAMLAVGVWLAYRSNEDLPWRTPVLFLLMLAAGAGLGSAGVSLPFAEPGIALSVASLGMMILFIRRIPELAGLIAISVFAVFHGYAHGAEAIGIPGVFAAGMLVGSIVLQGAGYAMGRQLMTRMARSAWLVGGALAATGLALLGA
jgi:urease accessory protein